MRNGLLKSPGSAPIRPAYPPDALRASLQDISATPLARLACGSAEMQGVRCAQAGRKEKVAFYMLLPMALLLIPSSWFESRRSVCLIRNIFGVNCPGCGMTRAISCVFHGNFKQAIHYNKLVVLIFPLLCYVWVRSVTTEFQHLRT